MTRRMIRIWQVGLQLGVAAWMGSSSMAAPATAPIELLWPSGPPSSNGLQESGNTKINSANINMPTLTVYRAPEALASGAAVVVIPGGAYAGVSMAAEGKAIAERLNARGITGLVLNYRLPNGHPEVPGDDARRAIRMARAKGAAWGIDPKRVGVWGFSAGGHLASTVATVFDAGKATSSDPIERMSSRPDFAILFYPVISMTKEIGHQGSRKNLIGEQDLVALYSNAQVQERSATE